MNGTMKQSMQQTMNDMMGGMMNGMMNRAEREACWEEREPALVAKDSRFSTFSMAAVAGSLLLCVGIIVYALFTA